MSKKFEDQVLKEINAFRQKPKSIQENLNTFKISLTRLKVAPDFQRDVEKFISSIEKIQPTSPLTRDSELDKVAKDYLNNFVEEEDDQQYFTTNKLKDKIPNNLIDQKCSIVISDGADEPINVVTQVLLNKLDTDRVGRNGLTNNSYKLIGLSHTVKDDENIIAIVMAEEPKSKSAPSTKKESSTKVNTPKLDSVTFANQVFAEITKYRKMPKVLLKFIQKLKEDAIKCNKSQKVVNDLDSYMKELAKGIPLPKIDRDPELDKAAQTEIKNALNDDDYDAFQHGSEVPSIPNTYDESVVILDTGAEDPANVLPSILSNRIDKEKIGRSILADPETSRCGIAHGVKNDQNKVIVILAKEPVEEDNTKLPEDYDLTELKKAFDYYDINKKGVINTKKVVENMKKSGFDKENPEIFKIMKDLSKEHAKCRFPTFAKFIIDYISDRESNEGIKNIFNCFLKNGQKDINAIDFREMVNSLGPQEKESLDEIDTYIVNKPQSAAKLTLKDFQEYMSNLIEDE